MSGSIPARDPPHFMPHPILPNHSHRRRSHSVHVTVLQAKKFYRHIYFSSRLSYLFFSLAPFTHTPTPLFQPEHTVAFHFHTTTLFSMDFRIFLRNSNSLSSLLFIPQHFMHAFMYLIFFLHLLYSVKPLHTLFAPSPVTLTPSLALYQVRFNSHVSITLGISCMCVYPHADIFVAKYKYTNLRHIFDFVWEISWAVGRKV